MAVIHRAMMLALGSPAIYNPVILISWAWVFTQIYLLYSRSIQHMDGADMRTFFVLMLLGAIVAGAAGVVYAAKIKVGTAVTFPVDI